MMLCRRDVEPRLKDVTIDLPTCIACGAVQWPPREACGVCLHGEVLPRPQPATGTLIATTVLHHTLDDAFRDQLPLRIGLARLDVGPSVLVFVAAGRVATGDRITLTGARRHDPADGGLTAFTATTKSACNVGPARTRNGIPLLDLPDDPVPVTMALVNRLRDDLP